jgi:hypothetical protein
MAQGQARCGEHCLDEIWQRLLPTLMTWLVLGTGMPTDGNEDALQPWLGNDALPARGADSEVRRLDDVISTRCRGCAMITSVAPGSVRRRDIRGG